MKYAKDDHGKVGSALNCLGTILLALQLPQKFDLLFH